MAARKRDHKAEYARRKARAASLGYPSVYSYRRARTTLHTPRTELPISFDFFRMQHPEAASDRRIKRLRREAAKWTKKHSHSDLSRYTSDMSDEEVERYHHAYVERIKGMSRRKARREKRDRIKQYVMDYHGVTEEEWTTKYELQTV